MPKVIFHIGLHKTGTITLQKELYPVCPKLHFLDQIKDEDIRNFELTLISVDPIYFDQEKTIKLIKPKLSKQYPNLISSEALSGPPFSGIQHGIDHRSGILQNIKKISCQI